MNTAQLRRWVSEGRAVFYMKPFSNEMVFFKCFYTINTQEEEVQSTHTHTHKLKTNGKGVKGLKEVKGCKSKIKRGKYISISLREIRK